MILINRQAVETGQITTDEIWLMVTFADNGFLETGKKSKLVRYKEICDTRAARDIDKIKSVLINKGFLIKDKKDLYRINCPFVVFK